jgi:hypothetical protein
MPRKKTNPVQRMCEAFGGTNEFAAVCGVDPSRVRHWRSSSAGKPNGRDGAIPDIYFSRILAAAKKRGIRVQPGELVNV